MIYESDVCGAMLGGENRSRLVPLASVLGQEGLAEEGKHRGAGGQCSVILLVGTFSTKHFSSESADSLKQAFCEK